MSDDVYDYGFSWGPMWVTRAATLGRGERVLLIETDARKLEVMVSPKGQSVRVWLDGTPLVEFGETA